MGILDRRDSVVIGRLRVQGVSGDGPSDQRKAAGLLRNASLRSHHVPPNGLLCVRVMRDPAPRTQPLGDGRSYLSPSWELALNRQLDRHAADAVRPVRGRVAAGAESVLFLDDAEVLACLASDWIHGTLARHWWWRQVLKSFDCSAVLEKWIRSAQAVPAAVELLHAWGADERFVAQIPDPLADTMLREVQRVHGVASADGQASVVLPSDVTQRDEGHVAQLHARHPGRRESSALPWSPFVAMQGRAALSLSQRHLLIQALMLRRAPDVARSAEFQRELSACFASETPGERTSTSEANAAGKKVGARKEEEEEQGLGPLTSVGGDSPRPMQWNIGTDAINSGAEVVSLLRDSRGTLTTSHQANSSMDPAAPKQESRSGDNTASGHLEASRLAEKTPAKSPVQAPEVDPAQVANLPHVHTSFGGLFFLLNVSIALGFYSDFSAPVAAQLDLNIWDFVAIFGELFTRGKLRDDPLWSLLAGLAGRGDEEVPGGQNPWLLAPRGEWIDATAQRITDFLRVTLGCDHATELLCAQAAYVKVTSADVDVFFSMETHPIEVRVACLDRDPGWIPAGGRHVAYHFD